jgi:hypothetical protein
MISSIVSRGCTANGEQIELAWEVAVGCGVGMGVLVEIRVAGVEELAGSACTVGEMEVVLQEVRASNTSPRRNETLYDLKLQGSLV